MCLCVLISIDLHQLSTPCKNYYKFSNVLWSKKKLGTLNVFLMSQGVTYGGCPVGGALQHGVGAEAACAGLHVLRLGDGEDALPASAASLVRHGAVSGHVHLARGGQFKLKHKT